GSYEYFAEIGHNQKTRRPEDQNARRSETQNRNGDEQFTDFATLAFWPSEYWFLNADLPAHRRNVGRRHSAVGIGRTGRLPFRAFRGRRRLPDDAAADLLRRAAGGRGCLASQPGDRR